MIRYFAGLGGGIGAGRGGLPPSIMSISISNSDILTIDILFDQTMNGAIPNASAFSVPGKTLDLVTIGGSGNNTIKVRSTTAFESIDVVTLSYTKPALNPIKSSIGVSIDSFTNSAVTNGVNLALHFEFTNTTAATRTATLTTKTIVGKTLNINWGDGTNSTIAGTGSNVTTNHSYPAVMKTYYLHLYGDIQNLTYFSIGSDSQLGYPSSDAAQFKKITAIGTLELNATGSLWRLRGDITDCTCFSRIIYLYNNGLFNGDLGSLSPLASLRIQSTGHLYGNISKHVNSSHIMIYSDTPDGVRFIEGDISIFRNVNYVNIEPSGGCRVTGQWNNSNIITLVVTTGNTCDFSFSTVPNITNLTLNPDSRVSSYPGKVWSAGMQAVRLSPGVGYGLSLAHMTQLIIDLSVPTWTGIKLVTLPSPNASMADTTQGGIWGDFSGVATPSALATALKLLAKTKTVTTTINGITNPGVSGDGTGFPAGFGDWWRS